MSNKEESFLSRAAGASTMKIGFTGTRRGMTNAQKRVVQMYLAEQIIERAYHGGCVGADIDFDSMFVGTSVEVRVWPSNIKSTQGHWSSLDTILPEQPPLLRNELIVDLSDQMIACPNEHSERLRSGTWATIRYARKVHKPLMIVFPDGTWNR